MATLLAEARGGDAASAAMTAMLIHCYPTVAQQQGLSTLYHSLLAQTIHSKDPELLACLAEELVIGRRLAADARMAHRSLTKSNELSGFMGAYVVARLVAAKKPKLALKYLRKGREAGHIPSMVLENHLKARRLPRFARVLCMWINVLDFFRSWRAVSRKDRRKLWRGTDTISGAAMKKRFLETIGPDRATPFSRIEAFIPVKARPIKVLEGTKLASNVRA